MNNLIPALAATVAPVVLLLVVAYPLRPQYGRQRAHPVTVQQIIDRLDSDAAARPTFGNTTRPPAFTVPTRRTLWVAS